MGFFFLRKYSVADNQVNKKKTTLFNHVAVHFHTLRARGRDLSKSVVM